MDDIQRARGAARRKARAAPLGNGFRRRGCGDQLHARPADAGRGARGRVADHPRGRGLLQRHEDDPQRAAGRRARARRVASGDLSPLPGAERARARGRLRLRDRPRPAAARRDRPLPGVEGALDLARPHRLLRAEPGGARRSCCRRSRATTRRCSICPSTRRARRACLPRTSGRRRSTRSRRRTWRCRRRTRPTSSTSSASTSSGRC